MKTELSITDQAFVKEYVKTRNGTEAYAKSHPRCRSRKAAGVEAVRVLDKPSVQATIKRALGLTDLQDELQQCLDQAKQANDRKEWRNSVMDYAKLAGLIVDKAEVKTITDDERNELRRILRDQNAA